MLKDYFLLAFGNLKHRGIRSWLTMLGIFIGIAAVVSLISLGSGLQSTMNAQFGVSSTEVITIQAGGLNAYGPPGSAVVTPLTVEDMEKIKRLNGVEKVLRRNLGYGKLEFNDRVIFGMIMNIPGGEDRKYGYQVMDLEAETGRLLEDGDDQQVILGNNFFTDKVGLGKSVKKGDTVKVQNENFEVAGILKKKGSFIFDNIVFMNDEPIQDLMEIGDEVDIISVQVEDPERMDEVKERIENALRKSRGVKEGEEDFEVSTPEAAMETVNQVLGGIQIFVFIIAFISIIVGVIGIVNTMTTSVTERRKEIGIMKAIGAKNSHIFLIFLIESGLMGFFGGLMGVLVGTLIGYLGTSAINSFLGATTKLDINFLFMGIVLFGSFLIGTIAGIIPAMNAAKQNIVESLGN